MNRGQFTNGDGSGCLQRIKGGGFHRENYGQDIVYERRLF